MLGSEPPNEQWEVHSSRGRGRTHLAADKHEEHMTLPPCLLKEPGSTADISNRITGRSAPGPDISPGPDHGPGPGPVPCPGPGPGPVLPSPQICQWRRRDTCSSREAQRLRGELDTRIQKLRAIDERRVVYVGRIRRSMTPGELKERFSQFGEVESVSLHFRERGDHYGFVTFYNTEDAFAAIDNGSKIRRPDELPFDICFGGRRQFCSSDYADLDASRDADPSPSRDQFEDLDFDALLKQAQGGLQR
ncbi:hypothetical protein OJAV_G00002030 [Oryzias javanicus]|uniref:RRM domain-containing protein n=1 Tax=Oryzias javanicus TaxID=123683 RepID=A0A3S2UQ30_ORYJA|nr:hypothetical protein OJAV_G00002030 [Oryzias javanicus]